MSILISVAGAVLLISLAVFSLLLIQPRWLFSFLSSRSPGVIYFAKTRQPVVALTIDDGPDPETTPMILAVLEKHHAWATFFLVSDRLPGNEALVERLLQSGHEIGNHLKDEVPSIRLAPGLFVQALHSSHARLSHFGNLRWFRPGSGWYNREMLAAVDNLGYQCVLGSIYPFDAQVASERFSRLHLAMGAAPGAVIILHDCGDRGRRTAAVLEATLPKLAEKGYQVTTLSKLIEQSDGGRFLESI
jgi:peptidoglycan/xylan/chitin deacetylase (PgdA/CDA1 family)